MSLEDLYIRCARPKYNKYDKLEAIKAKVDPQGLFQCQKCVGFKGPVRDQ